MTTERLDHVAIVVDDLAAAIEFFVDLGSCRLMRAGGLVDNWRQTPLISHAPRQIGPRTPKPV
jgi:catechol 2,3-dioxygenase-like lactoylglutathione lyase family enzyme